MFEGFSQLTQRLTPSSCPDCFFYSIYSLLVFVSPNMIHKLQGPVLSLFLKINGISFRQSKWAKLTLNMSKRLTADVSKIKTGEILYSQPSWAVILLPLCSRISLVICVGDKTMSRICFLSWQQLESNCNPTMRVGVSLLIGVATQSNAG